MEEKGGYERPLGEMKPELDHKEQVNKMALLNRALQGILVRPRKQRGELKRGPQSS